MVYILLLWAIMFCRAVGFAKVILRLSQKEEARVTSIYLLVFIGIFFEIFLLSILHFFIPISFVSFLITSVVAILGFVLNTSKTKFIKLTNKQIILAIIVIFYISMKAILEPSWADSRLYHAQIISWYNHFPVTKGISNLFCAYGLNSFFHLYASQYTLDFLKYVPSASSSFWMLIYSLYIITAYKGKPVYLFGLLVLFFVAFWGWESSPSPDSMVCILVVIGFLEYDKSSTSSLSQIYLLMSIVIVPLIKQTNGLYSLIILPLFLKKGNTRFILFIIFLIVIWVIRNLIMSGYPLYPLTWFDYFDLQHKVPRIFIERWHFNVTHFARFPVDNWQEVIGKPYYEWIPEWFSLHRKSEKLLIIITCITFPYGLYKSIKAQNRKRILAYFSIFLSILFLIFMIPSMRFLYPFVFINLIWFLDYFNFNQFIIHKITFYVLILLFSSGCLFSIWKYDYKDTLVFPLSYSKSELSEITLNQNVVVRVPVTERCANAKIPCIYNLEHRKLYSFTENIRDGFYMFPTPEFIEEDQKLRGK